jgi:REP element-mobilizing transposase RayT
MGWEAKGRGAQAEGQPAAVAHRTRGKFRNGALHITLRLRSEVWNLRTRRCFRALRQAFEQGCARFGFRVIHFSVQGTTST